MVKLLTIRDDAKENTTKKKPSNYCRYDHDDRCFTPGACVPGTTSFLGGPSRKILSLTPTYKVNIIDRH